MGGHRGERAFDGGTELNLRHYQQDAVTWLSRTRRGIVQAPAGSGKTIIAAAALTKVLALPRDCRPRIGWMANSIDQYQQAEAAIERFPIREQADVIIGCAAGNLPTATFDVLVVDECHHGTAPGWSKLISACPGARWGFSATPWTGDKMRDDRLRALFAGKVCTIGRHELVADGHLAPAEVEWITIEDPALGETIEGAAQEECAKRLRKWRMMLDPKETLSRCRWQFSVQLGIVENGARNLAAVNAVEGLLLRGRNVLSLVNTIEHGQMLCERLGVAGVEAALCYAKLGKKRRREMIEAFRAGDLKCLFATSLADEGLDVPCADALVLINAGRSPAKLEQRTGRVLRAYKGKQSGIIVDFRDLTHPMLKRQSDARRALYRRLGYSVVEGVT